MAWGVVEDRVTPFPAGTVRLNEKKEDGESLPKDAELKKRGAIILQPQPSDDPNDPLNWPLMWKIIHITIISLGTSVSNALTTMVVPGIAPMVDKYGASEADISSFIISAITFWTSIASFFIVAAGDVWGRRPLYVISVLLLAISNLLAYLAQTFPVLVAARTAAGFAITPLLVLPPVTIADMFFFHERGTYVALWALMLNSGGQVSQIIAGFIVDALGISAVFGFASIAFAVLFPVVYFCVFESAYFVQRKPARPASVSSSQWDSDDEILVAKGGAAVPRRQPYIKRLALFRGRVSNVGFWKGSLQPFCMMVSPVVIYSTILSSMMFLVVANAPTLVSIILAAPPYGLTPTQIGLTNIPLAVVGILGGPIIGWASDALTRFMARTNGTTPGVAEPEFRLTLLLITMPITAVGLIGLGASVSEGLPLVWVLIWLSTISVGSLTSIQISINYIIDAYASNSARAFVTINGVGATVGFILAGPMVNWLAESGPVVVFSTFASATFITLVLTLPMYVFGKRIRGYYARAAWAQKLERFQETSPS